MPRSGTATQPRNRGGPTSAGNGLGMCERCNYVKEAPGWHVCAGDENGVHTAEFTTPTGMRHRRPGHHQSQSAKSKSESASRSHRTQPSRYQVLVRITISAASCAVDSCAFRLASNSTSRKSPYT
jgi:hypothetical protein